MGTKNDWESLERDSTKGFEILGREAGDVWEVEVRFDDETPPQRDSESARSRAEAITVGREIVMTWTHK